ncbi:MAG: DUF354 domain-containing protein [Anaerolineales bacterium]
MRILIDINHPAHVHLFRNAADAWRARGDEVLLTATQKGVVDQLLASYDLPYRIIYTRRPGRWNLARELIVRTAKLSRVMLGFRPDVIVSLGSPTAAWAATLLRKPHIAFDDTEDSVGQAWLYRPFSRHVCVPEAFMVSFGRKEVRYPGYHELAYLHPARFVPNPAKIAPLSTGERYFVVRYIDWDAAHDAQHGGLSAAGKKRLIGLLSQQGRVVLSLEKQAPVILKPDGTPGEQLPAESMHHLLAFAALYAGEGVTAASEAAILGTPAILINSRELGYILEQQDRYQLAYHFKDEDAALAKISRILAQDDLRSVWRCRQELMLSEKTDVTAWMIDFIDGVVRDDR